MKKQGFRPRLIRAMMALAVGGSAFQISGCDPDVRNALLTGLESTTQTLTAALISAAFLSLQDDGSVSLTTP